MVFILHTPSCTLLYTQLQEEVQLDQEKEQEKEQDNVQEKEPEQENYRVAMGKFVCTHCGKEYKQLGSLVKHLKKNHDISSTEFICTVCKKDMTSKKN